MSPSYRTGAPVSSRWDGDFLLLHRTPKHAFTSKPLPLRLLGKEKTDLDSKVGGSTYLSKAGSIHLSGIGGGRLHEFFLKQVINPQFYCLPYLGNALHFPLWMKCLSAVERCVEQAHQQRQTRE